MAVVRIDVRKTRSQEDIESFCKAVQLATLETLNVRSSDLHVIYSEHDSNKFITPPKKSDLYTLVDVVLSTGRRLEAKRAFYQAVVRNLSEQGVPSSEVLIVLNEQPLENWGIRKGQAACDVELGFKLDTKGTARIQDFHRYRLGLTPQKELGWADQDSQLARFGAICSWGDLSDCTVLDFGCGYGDLRPFINDRFENVNYLGVELMPEFINEAILRYGEIPNTSFIQGEFLKLDLPQVDVVLASGSLSYRNENPLHTQITLSRMWEIASKGIAFNMLDASVSESNSVVVSRDPEQILAYCRNLDPNAELVTGYLPEDFTILMRKP